MSKWGGLSAFAGFIMQGTRQAVVALTGLTLLSSIVPLLGMLSSAALALLALRKGIQESLKVALASGTLVALCGLLLIGNIQSALAYCLILWMPIWLIAIVLRETGSMALAMEAALILGIIAILAMYGMTLDPSIFWNESLQSLMKPLLENAPSDFDVKDVRQNIESVSHYMSGIVVAGSIASLIFALLIARWWQAELFNPGGFKDEFLNLSLHAIPTYACIALSVVAFATEGLLSELAWNIEFVFFLLFAVSGFSILHALFSGKKLWLTVIYIALFFIPHVLLPIILLGLSDIWMNWRRFAKTI